MTASTNRTIVIGGTQSSTPALYGTHPATPIFQWPQPQPGAFLDYALDLTGPLEGDTITAASLTVSPAGGSELIYAFLNVTGPVLSWWGFGGIAGRSHIVSVLAQTAGFRRIPLMIGLSIDRLLASYPLPPAPIPGFGPTLTWSLGNAMLGPVMTLPTVTVVATGTTQLGAAPVPLAQVLVNSGAGGGISLPQAATFGGQTMSVYNRSGGALSIYPYAGDAIESYGSNAPAVVQNLQTARFSVVNSGLLILS